MSRCLELSMTDRIVHSSPSPRSIRKTLDGTICSVRPTPWAALASRAQLLAEPVVGAMATTALGNEQRGKHDAVLDFFIEKHQNDAELVIDTVVDLLKRRGLLSPDEFTSGLTEAGYLAAWRRHVAGALDRSVEVRAAAGPPEPAVAPGQAATITEDMLDLPVTMSKSAQKALDKAKADAAAMAGYGWPPTAATQAEQKHVLRCIIPSHRPLTELMLLAAADQMVRRRK